MYACEPGVAGEVGEEDADEDADTGGGIRAVLDVTVLVDAVDSSVHALCDGTPYAKPSCSIGSGWGKLLDTAICGICPIGVGGGSSRSWRSILRSTRSDALRIVTEGSSGRTKSDVKSKSDGPIGYVGVERL